MAMIVPNLLLTSIAMLQFLSHVISIYPEIPCDGLYIPNNCENATWESLETVEDFARCAPARLSPALRSYFWSGSGNQRTLKENEEAYGRIHIKARVLQDVSRKNLSTQILGKWIQFPIGTAPTAAQGLAHPDGDIATAKGTWDMGTIMIMSSYATIPLEIVAASVPKEANIWMQLYIFKDRTITEKLVRRAEKAGFKALVVTLDDVADTYVRCGKSQNFFEWLVINKGVPNLSEKVLDSSNPKLSNQDISWLSKFTTLPIIVKGIMTGEDALTAIRAGASAIYVSNHGGRQLDSTIATIDALPEVVDTVRRWYPYMDIYVDGGIYNGYDVFKAIARGATAVFIGRANLWGLTMGGENGVKKVLTILKQQFEDAMLHAGFNNPREININSLIPPYPNFQNK